MVNKAWEDMDQFERMGFDGEALEALRDIATRSPQLALYGAGLLLRDMLDRYNLGIQNLIKDEEE